MKIDSETLLKHGPAGKSRPSTNFFNSLEWFWPVSENPTYRELTIEGRPPTDEEPG
jgi:hypothetical protein